MKSCQMLADGQAQAGRFKSRVHGLPEAEVGVPPIAPLAASSVSPSGADPVSVQL